MYSTDYGWGLFKDGDEKNSGASAARYRRTYTWDEKNQLISSVDANYSTAYVYGQDGQRSNKYTQSSETLYFNKMWTLHTDSGNNVYGGQTAKNIYLGETRIVTKLNSGSSPTYQEEYYKQYFYHSDHLGSASLISDYKGDEYQRIEYTPYGETWVEKTSNTGLEFLPYKFTAKELLAIALIRSFMLAIPFRMNEPLIYIVCYFFAYWQHFFKKKLWQRRTKRFQITVKNRLLTS